MGKKGSATAHDGVGRELDLGPDARLLSELSRDGRASYEELASRLGTSRQTVWRRVKALMGSLIWGFSTVIDHQHLGWRQYIVSIPGAPDPVTIRRVEAAEAAVAEAGTVRVLQSSLVRGAGWRFVVQVAAKNALAMEVFLQALRDRFPGGERDWQVDEVEYVVREAGFPNPRRHELLGPDREGGK